MVTLILQNGLSFYLPKISIYTKYFTLSNLSVWGLAKKRKQISDMASAIFAEALSISKTEGYHWSLNIQASDIRLVDDLSTNTPLKRAMIALEFKIL